MHYLSWVMCWLVEIRNCTFFRIHLRDGLWTARPRREPRSHGPCTHAGTPACDRCGMQGPSIPRPQFLFFSSIRQLMVDACLLPSVQGKPTVAGAVPCGHLGPLSSALIVLCGTSCPPQPSRKQPVAISPQYRSRRRGCRGGNAMHAGPAEHNAHDSRMGPRCNVAEQGSRQLSHLD